MRIIHAARFATLSISASLCSTAAFAQGAAASGESALEEVVITGSRIQTPTGFTTPTPVTIVGEEMLQQRAAVNVGEMLNEMPAFRQTQGPEQAGRLLTGAAGGQVNIDLRGLGTVRTLTLLDGRRHVGSNVTGTLDTSLIPASLIKRVEVVTGGASAAYGSDAVSGVVNFILDDKLQGARASLQYGRSEQGDNEERALSVGLGTAFAGDRGHVIFGGDYSDSRGVSTVYNRTWGRKEEGVVTNTAAQRAAGAPNESLLPTVEFSTLAPGSIINSAVTNAGATVTNAANLTGFTFGPGGIAYRLPVGVAYNSPLMQGTANYGYTPNGNFNLRPPIDRYSGLVRTTFDFTDSLTAFVEAGYAHRYTNNISSFHQTASLRILNTNPYLPAFTLNAMTTGGYNAINVGRLDIDWGGLPAQNTTDSARGVAGLRGKFLDNWNWDFYYQYGRSTNETYSPRSTIESAIARSSYVVNGPNGPECGPIATNPNLTADTVNPANGQIIPGTRGLVAAIDSARGATCVPFNIFGPYSASPAAIDYVTGISQGTTTLKQDVAAFNVSGEPVTLWAGPLGAAAGVEYRKDSLQALGNVLAALSSFSTINPQTFKGDNTVKEGYLELAIPLLKDMPGAKSLDMNLAGRVTNYETSGTVNTWKAGLSYAPIDMLRLRATKSRDIRAPNLNELYAVAGTVTAATLISNPFKSAQRIPTQNAGNALLVPEVADTFTAGIVFQPGSGLKASLDYYSIEVNDVITTIASADLLQFCYNNSPGGTTRVPDMSNVYCSGITFAPDGTVTLLKNAPQNLNKLKTSGVDLELSYDVPIDAIGLPGKFNMRALATFLSELATTSVSSAGSTTVERAGVANQGMPKRIFNFNLAYSVGSFATATQLRYTSPVIFDALKRDPADADYNAAASNSINKNHFPSSFYLNWNLAYDLIKNDRHQLQLFGVVNNLLNRDPPELAIAVFTTASGNPYDFIGRSYKFGFRYKL